MPNSPAMEMAERVAETLPGLKAAAAAVGLQDHQRMLRDHARRVKDSHRLMAEAAGLKVDESVDDMGDIIITGDITHQPPKEKPPAPLGTLAKVGMAAALLGTGAAIPLGVNALANRPASAPAVTDNDTPWELRIVPEEK